MARIDNNQKLNAFLSNEKNFIAVKYNDPRAVEMRAKSATLNAKKQAVRAARAIAIDAYAAEFVIGQIVRAARGIQGEVIAIDGQIVSVNVGGVVRKFQASFVTAA